MNDFTISINNTSKEFSVRERIKIKDTTNAVKLDEAIQPGQSLTIEPAAYAVLDVHNEKSDNKDYNLYVIIASDGTKYVTGSNSFWTSFKAIWDEMKDETEPYSIVVYKVDSKNYKGKYFLTCSIV